MATYRFRTLAGDVTTVKAAEVEKFTDDVHGRVVLPGDPAYEAARRVWNGMIDRRPALIVQAAGTQDVIAAVNFAREHGLRLAVRGGGHNVAGSALADDGVVIDLSAMRSVTVDPEARIAHVGGGAKLGDVDDATQRHGLATPLGVVSATGVAGLTLGGGYGWLTRRYGLSSDNVRSVEIVTADGVLRTASSTEAPDLFWAIRGGGGNFGVVTSFDYHLHPVGPEVYMLATFYPAAQAAEGLRYFRDFMAAAPNELFALGILWNMPEAPDFPEAHRGEPVLVFAGVYSGDAAEGERVVAPLRTFSTPLADISGPVSWLEAQSFFDADYPDGDLYYWKSIHLDRLTPEAIDQLMDLNAARPSPRSTIDVWYLGGAMPHTAPEATPIWDRTNEVMIGVESNWSDPAQSDANIAWTRRVVRELKPYATGGSYVNFGGFGPEEDNPLEGIYGGNYARLRQIKRAYDPDNLFRVNHNIPPAEG